MQEYLSALEHEFQQHADAKIAVDQKAYMRDQFEYYGMKTETRRTIQKPFLVKAYLPPKAALNEIVKTLWEKPQREYHYFAQELAFKYVKQIEKEDIVLFEFMITHNSWWDTVDFIATKLLSAYFKAYPDQIKKCTNQWLKSNNLWLQRSALLFQLKWKKEIDTDLLGLLINSLTGSDEFFINKAIGWVLREYSRTNPEWVLGFVEETPLHNLSKREALRLIK